MVRNCNGKNKLNNVPELFNKCSRCWIEFNRDWFHLDIVIEKTPNFFFS